MSEHLYSPVTMDDKPAQGQPLAPLPNVPASPLPPPAQPEFVPPSPSPSPSPVQEPPPIVSQPVEAEIQPDEPTVFSDTPPPLEMESAQIPSVPPPPPQSGEVSLMPEPPPPIQSGSTPAQGGKKKLFIIIPLVAVAVLILVFVVFRGRGESNLTSTAQPTAAPTIPPAGGPTPIAKTAPFTLSLTAPQEGQIATTSSILIKGTTASNAAVVFLTDKNFESTESGTTGSFSGNLKLSSGTNDILIVAVNSKGEKKSEARKVTFGTEATGSALVKGKMQAIAGIITGINGAILTVLDKSQNDAFYNLKVASAAAIRLSGNEKASLSALSLGQAALAVVTLDEEGNLVANLIHAIAK